MSLHVRDLVLPAGVKLVSDPDLSVISVVTPAALEEETPGGGCAGRRRGGCGRRCGGAPAEGAEAKGEGAKAKGEGEKTEKAEKAEKRPKRE